MRSNADLARGRAATSKARARVSEICLALPGAECGDARRPRDLPRARQGVRVLPRRPSRRRHRVGVREVRARRERRPRTSRPGALSICRTTLGRAAGSGCGSTAAASIGAKSRTSSSAATVLRRRRRWSQSSTPRRSPAAAPSRESGWAVGRCSWRDRACDGGAAAAIISPARSPGGSQKRCKHAVVDLVRPRHAACSPSSCSRSTRSSS